MLPLFRGEAWEAGFGCSKERAEVSKSSSSLDGPGDTQTAGLDRGYAMTCGPQVNVINKGPFAAVARSRHIN
jgi:hypothetical protein